MMRDTDNAKNRISRLAWLACFLSSGALAHGSTPVPSQTGLALGERAKQEASAMALSEKLLGEGSRAIGHDPLQEENRAAELAQQGMQAGVVEAQAVKQALQESAASVESQAKASAEEKLAELARHEAQARAAERARQEEQARPVLERTASMARQEEAARVEEETRLEAAAQLEAVKDNTEPVRQEAEAETKAYRQLREQAVNRALEEALAKISVQNGLGAEARKQEQVKPADHERALMEMQDRARVAEQAQEEDRARAASRSWLEQEAEKADTDRLVTRRDAQEDRRRAVAQAAELAGHEERSQALSLAMLKADEDRMSAEERKPDVAGAGNGVIVSLYRRAAESGNTDAQVGLGRFYMQGRGVERDVVQAYKWFDIAARGGGQDAAAGLNAVEGDMSREQIELAKKLAQEWPEIHK